MSGRLQMNIFDGLDDIVKKDYPLAEHTWYGLGGPAEFFIRPRTVEELKAVAIRCLENDLPTRVMGFGSNLLVADAGVSGAVIKLDQGDFVKTEFDDTTVRAWAGVDLAKFVYSCVEKGLSGLEGLTGIPGSVGGAVRMNAGGSFGDIGMAVETVTVMDSSGNIFTRSKPDLMFDYRKVNITGKYIISATMKLNQADPEQILHSVQEIWIYKKNHQPLSTRNAGCIFKNPPGQKAGSLIDRAGLKGTKIGGAKVSEKHANFIIAEQDCTSDDVMRLIRDIQSKVREHFDIELEPEIEIWK